MSLKNQLIQALHAAMREKNDVRKNALRMALASIKLAEVENRAELDKSVVISILHKEIKTREETITEASNGGRQDMIAPIQAEIQVIKEFLPQEFTDAELLALIKNVCMETKAVSINDMGIVMKSAIQQAAGRATNDRISKQVRKLLSE